MQSLVQQSGYRRAIPPPRLVLQSATQHQAACTHLTVTRLFGLVRCQVCAKIPRIGWVYACTQDHEQELCHVVTFLAANCLPDASAYEIHMRLSEAGLPPCEAHHLEQPLSEGMAAYDLAPWISKAVDDGHYTAEQVETIKAQKRGVREMIAKAEEELDSSSSSSKESHVSAYTRSTSSEEAVPYNHNNLQENKTSSGEAADHPCSASHKQKTYPSVHSICHARICHQCRTTFRERASVSIDEVILQDPRLIREDELGNRPLSDANVLKNLMSRRLRRVRQAISDGKGGVSAFENMSIGAEWGTSQLEENQGRDEDSVEDSFEKALEEAKAPVRHGLTTGVQQTRYPQPEGFGAAGRSTGHSISYSNMMGQDKDTNNDSQMLLARNTHLPDIAEDVEGPEDGEVEVEDGIAVTEEGVSNSAADIILQG